MSGTILRADGISKCYTIAHQKAKGDGARHLLESAVRNPMKAVRSVLRRRAAAREQFWALDDVSFEVEQGDVLGVVGRNGSGKSTLLKILSRITTPTSGRIEIRGRVASLLEVGTGFHPELTGRENVFLNGAILGMSRKEILGRFDEIVAFAEVEKFLDTPVKRYSSGMYVRLAFAVAAHLEPDILIVDEVLAVGDDAFQKKCLGKMDQVSSRDGRTVLLVSHNMGTISRLCRKAILLDRGRLQASGDTTSVVSAYLRSSGAEDGLRRWDAETETNPSDPFLPVSLTALDADGHLVTRVNSNEDLFLEFEYHVRAEVPRFRVSFQFTASDGGIVFTASESAHPSYESKPTGVGCYVSRCRIPRHLLNEGRYTVRVAADIPFKKYLFEGNNAMTLVVDAGHPVFSRYPEKWPGVVRPLLEWEVCKSA